MTVGVATLKEKFRGCLLGSAVGDVAGAVVEAESPGYIGSTFRSIDNILAAESVEEFSGPPWRVGRFTDDTQMMLCVAEWLIAGESDSPQRLLARFADAHEPFRRYGPGTESVLRLYRQGPAQWRELATAAFPAVARESSRPTHSHPLAYQGAVIQAVAVATATRLTEFSADAFLAASRAGLRYFADLLQDTSRFARALDAIETGLARGTSCAEMSVTLGTGVTSHEAVPMALYCFLRHPNSYADVIHHAVFIGGDTDTIASMAGAISGAFLGDGAIPSHWSNAIREAEYDAGAIKSVADRLLAKYGEPAAAPGQ